MIEIVEASYQVAQDTEAWLNGILKAAEPQLDHAAGVVACCYELQDFSKLRLSAVVGMGIPMPMWTSGFRLAASRLSAKDVQRSFASRTFGTVSQVMGPRFLERNAFARALRLFGMADAMGINALDPTGFGCMIGAGLPGRRAAPPELEDLMSYVGAHIAAGHRLRRQIEQAWEQRPSASERQRAGTEYLLESAEAILNPEGQLAHATEATKGLAERLMIRAAASAFDRARRRQRRSDPRAALLEWKALVGGRWSLVDCFDSDGRRFLVASRNDPEPHRHTHSEDDPLAGLTLRERQVVGYATLGHANKVIAYELGIATSSVANHLANATAKLGLGSRAELIARACWPTGLRASAKTRIEPQGG